MRKVTDINFKIFVDFDGTITRTDVGEAMFLEFGDPDKAREIVQRWIDKEIDSKQSWIELCETIPSLDMKSFNKFIDGIEIDPTFNGFAKFCADRNYEIRVLSDGLDYYINRILDNAGFSDIEKYSNKVKFEQNNRPVPSFPFTVSVPNVVLVSIATLPFVSTYM